MLVGFASDNVRCLANKIKKLYFFYIIKKVDSTVLQTFRKKWIAEIRKTQYDNGVYTCTVFLSTSGCYQQLPFWLLIFIPN